MDRRFVPSRSTRLRAIAIAGALLLAASAVRAAAPDRKAPTTPTNLTITGTTAYSVSLAWGASTDNSGSPTYRIVNLSGGPTVTVPGNQTTYTYAKSLFPQ